MVLEREITECNAGVSWWCLLDSTLILDSFGLWTILANTASSMFIYIFLPKPQVQSAPIDDRCVSGL
jgi:hypothetical protein